MHSLLRRWTLNRWDLASVLSISFATIWGCDEQLPPAPAMHITEGEGCRVSGRVVSTEWRNLGGGIERAIVSVWKLPEVVRVEQVYQEGEHFEFRLPPGKYRLVYSAIGTRGATFEGKAREITIAEDQERVDIEEVDLPISKTTGLYGKRAPELEGIIAWQDTPPISLKRMRGKVVVLDFFAHYCSICHEHKPDLMKLAQINTRRMG